MIRVLFTALVVAMVSIACASKTASVTGLINEALVQADRQRTAELARSRGELKLADGRSVNSCTDYLARVGSIAVEESLEAQQVKSGYLICEALDLIGRSRPPVAIAGDYGRRLADSLDLRSFPSSLHIRSDDVAHTLSVIAAENLTIDQVSVTMEESDWHYRLEVVAVRDINGNDTSDWIVWLTDEAKQGSYRGYATLVVFDPEVDTELVAASYAPGR